VQLALTAIGALIALILIALVLLSLIDCIWLSMIIFALQSADNFADSAKFLFGANSLFTTHVIMSFSEGD
jgi:hypothetical protein